MGWRFDIWYLLLKINAKLIVLQAQGLSRSASRLVDLQVACTVILCRNRFTCQCSQRVFVYKGPTSTDRLLARRGVRKSPRTHFAAFNSIFLLDQYHILPNKITKSQCLMGPAGVFVQGRFVRPTPADPLLQRKGGSSVSSHSGASG